MTKRAYVKALVGDLRRYLQWQQAQGVIGSSPASEADRAAFEAFKDARQERQLAQMRANLGSGSQPSGASRPPERASSRPSPERSRPPTSPPAERSAAERGGAAPRPSFKEPAAPAQAPSAPTSQNASDAGAPIWAQLGARTMPTFTAGGARGERGSQSSPDTVPGGGRPSESKASGPSTNTSSKPTSSPSAQKSTPVSLNDEPPPYDDYDGPMYDEVAYEDYSHEAFAPVDAPPSRAQPSQTRPAQKSAASMTPAEKMDFLQNYLGSCRRCGLCESRTQIVFGQGNPTARLMFIGDAPAVDDDRAGRPFAGASGELLSGMIKAMGLSREQVYITNVVKCRPPGDRRPQSGEVSECLPFLKKQIEVVQPEVIVALGGFATLALLGQAARRPEVRGSWQSFEGIALLPTFHPDDLLRDTGKKRPAWEDLQKVMKRLG